MRKPKKTSVAATETVRNPTKDVFEERERMEDGRGEGEREKEGKGKLRNGEEGGAIEVVVGCSFSLVRTMQRASNEAESRYATYSNTIPTVWQVGSLPLEV